MAGIVSKVCICRQQTPISYSWFHGSLSIKDGRERKQLLHAKEFLQWRVETLFFENTNKQTSKQAKEKTNSIQSINQSTLFKNEGKRITAEADKPEALQLN